MGLTNFPHGVTSFGFPVVPGGVPFHTNTRYIFVDTARGSDARVIQAVSAKEPVKTLGRAGALMADGYGDVAIVQPGSYAERLVPTLSHAKYISATPWMPRLTQIVGDGTNDHTVDIGQAAQEGFMLYGFEIDVPNGVEKCAIITRSDDATASPSAGASGYGGYIGNCEVRSNLTRKDPRCGILIAGGTLLKFGNLFLSGCEIGIGFCGNSVNMPSDIEFEGRIVFRDNVIADIATVTNEDSPITIMSQELKRIWFNETHHLDESGGVTRYLNLGSIAAVRCGISKMYTAQDIADGTMALVPAGWTFHEVPATRNIAS